jgi:hypothetical protein
MLEQLEPMLRDYTGFGSATVYQSKTAGAGMGTNSLHNQAINPEILPQQGVSLDL